jgi:TetR/AcrR family transcriptional regulator, fatty acid metabolism regulator protein
MRTKNSTTGQKSQSFIEAARRSQIIACAIDTIADLGYIQASLAQIAARAGISKGVITYHFASKDELMGEVVSSVLGAFAAFVQPQVEAESSAANALRAFIESNMAFMRTHRRHLLALLDIMSNARAEEGTQLAATDLAKADLANLEQLLRQGQQQGEFREFDTRVMAVAIMSLRNSVIGQLAADPELDLEIYARELVTLLDLATRRPVYEASNSR